MIYSPVIQHPQQKIAQDTYKEIASKEIARSRFLVIGYSSDAKGDHTVGIQVANHVSDWNMPSVQSVAVCQLTPNLVNDLASVDYAFFVSPCPKSSQTETLQLDPIVASSKPSRIEQSGPIRSNLEDTHSYTPIMLLSLAHRLFGHSPQAWRLRIPTASTDCNQRLSSTTQRGYDRALRTIEKFFMTYQQPIRIAQSCPQPSNLSVLTERMSTSLVRL